MTYLRCLFACPRNLLFRPSAIATGFVLAQLLGQYLSRGSLTGTCGDGSNAWRCP
jgi:hypothetical protein